MAEETHEFASRLGQPADEAGRSILLTVDGSAHSDEAFRWVAAKLLQPSDHVTLLYCFEAPVGGMDVTWMGDVEPTELNEQMTAEAERKGKALLRAAFDKCSDLGFKTSLVIKEGPPPKEAICQFVDEHSPDLVVMSSRGHGAVGRFFLGSTTDYVMHHSKVPVLVVHGDRNEAGDNKSA